MPCAPCRFESFCAVRAVDQRNVRELRHRPVERVIDLGLTAGIREMIRTTHDMRNAHIVIVDDDCEIVRRIAVGPDDDEIVEILIREHDPALHMVRKPPFLRRAELSSERCGLHIFRSFAWVAVTPRRKKNLRAPLGSRFSRAASISAGDA